MDNVIIYPEKIYYAIKNIHNSVSLMDEINMELRSIKNNSKNIDLHYLENKTKELNIQLDILHKKIEKIQSELLKMDSSVSVLFNYLDNKNNYIEIWNKYNQSHELDELKKKNKNTGALISFDSKSIVDNFTTKTGINKLLDTLKNNINDLECEKSTNISSIFSKEN